MAKVSITRSWTSELAAASAEEEEEEEEAVTAAEAEENVDVAITWTK